MTKALTTKEAFFKRQFKREVVPLDDEEGTVVHIREMNGKAREACELAALGLQEDKKPRQLFALFFIHSVCNTDGDLVFGEKDIPEVASLPCSILEPVFRAARDLSGMAPVPGLDDIPGN